MDCGRRNSPTRWKSPGRPSVPLENGRYNPSILLAFKIARYFGLTIEDIFIYEEDQT